MFPTLLFSFYLTTIFTDLEVGFLPFGVTMTLTEQVPFLTVLIAVPETLQIFFDDAETVSANFEPVGNFSFAKDNNFVFAVVAPAFTE
jgi:hypothetical protein